MYVTMYVTMPNFQPSFWWWEWHGGRRGVCSTYRSRTFPYKFCFSVSVGRSGFNYSPHLLQDPVEPATEQHLSCQTYVPSLSPFSSTPWSCHCSDSGFACSGRNLRFPQHLPFDSLPLDSTQVVPPKPLHSWSCGMALHPIVHKESEKLSDLPRVEELTSEGFMIQDHTGTIMLNN